jgi:protein-tyrosine-phosphatase
MRPLYIEKFPIIRRFFRPSIQWRAAAVLFVCLGNIIRSPTCEGLLRTLVTPDVVVHSAAVTADDLGSHPHRHVQRVCREHGFDISSHVARMVTPRDFAAFDVIVSLEPSVQRSLVKQAPQLCTAAIVEFVPGSRISNPWASPYPDFVTMYGQIEAAMPAFVEKNIPREYRKA